VYLRLLFWSGVLLIVWGCTHTPWADAPPFVPADTEECDVSAVSFSRDIVPIMEEYCYSCHKGVMVSGNISLDTYEGVKEAADDGSLVGSVTGDPEYLFMPEAAPPLTDCLIRKIVAWIANGSPEN
jgi:hypothetical protein